MKRTAKLRAQVTDISTRVADAAGVAIEQDIANSLDVPGTILREAEKRGTDLIVLGTRGERVENDPLGSVSSEVVKSAGTPILLVPPEVWRPDAQEVPS
jgi:nucleotide-binding universal stress UspA family protein